jgi:hypothetical protein
MPGFPKPCPREPYRAPAQRPVLPEETVPKPRRRTSAPAPEPNREPVPRIADVRREEREFWKRQSLVAQYPRPFALGVTLLGAFGTWSLLGVLAHGGRYQMVATLFMPVLFFGGLWPLLWGVPEEEDGTAPGWWVAGYGASVLCGFAIGVWLLWRLADATTIFS